MHASFPNALTVSRIFISALLVFFLALPGFVPKQVLIGLFTLGCLTDFLDGMLARRWKTVSGWGRVMDPLADKVLILSVLVMLTEKSLVPGWITALFVIRELWVTGVRSFRLMPASKGGKLKMAFQSLGLILILLQGSTTLTSLGIAFLLGALVLGYASMFQYMARFSDPLLSAESMDLCYTKTKNRT
jgi:CDP-diacylglycerol--glycerol-3-phosphate 3-phosphatidyltransferase